MVRTKINKYCLRCGRKYFIDKKEGIKYCLGCGQRASLVNKFKK